MLLLILALIVFAILLITRLGIPKNIEARPDTLVFTCWWGDELEGDALESMIREFEELNPGIKIQLNSLSYREMRNDLTGSLPEEPAPNHLLSRSDILALDPLWLRDLAGGSHLAAPEPALPLVSFMIPLFYNTEVLQAAGFNRPPANRSEFLEIARTLAARDRFGISLALSPENPQGVYRDIFPWFWAAGVGMIQEGKSFFAGRAVIDTLEFLDRLRQEGLVSPDSFSKNAEQKREEFISGRIGMMTASIRDISILRERMGAEGFGITAVPGPDNFRGKPAFGLTDWYAGISARTRHPDKARIFLSFLEEKAPFLAAAAWALPGSGTTPGNYVKDEPLFSKAWDLYEGGEIVREFNGIRRFRELEARFRIELLGLLEGGQSPAETAAAIHQGWEKILFQDSP